MNTEAKTRKSYTPQEKAQVALEAIVGEKSLSDIAKENGIALSMVTKWKEQAIKSIVKGFMPERKASKPSSKKADLDSMLKIIQDYSPDTEDE